MRAVPDLAASKRERDRIDHGVQEGRSRVQAAKADPLTAFNTAMQQAASYGYEARLATKTRDQRYQIFLANLRQAEQKNSKAGPDEVDTIDYFSVFTQQEVDSFRRGIPVSPNGVGKGRKLLYNNPSQSMPCPCRGPSERPFQFSSVDVSNIQAITWQAYMTPGRNQGSSQACG